jgi:hypothetical protein
MDDRVRFEELPRESFILNILLDSPGRKRVHEPEQQAAVPVVTEVLGA